ncbi:MAG: nucleotidyltransferase substrate binding protein [Oscillospiraceae bacterium]|nr:nucleotidyltransferase substrate binding protein [Oscillospiraceae bacterium]
MKKYENFSRALANLKEGAKIKEPYTVVEQVGIAGLFMICFEQAWKLMKEILDDHGRSDERIGSPRGIIKLAYQCGMIQNCEAWLELLESRNILTHTYSEEQALNIIRRFKTDFIPLFDELKTEIDTNGWL